MDCKGLPAAVAAAIARTIAAVTIALGSSFGPSVLLVRLREEDYAACLAPDTLVTIYHAALRAAAASECVDAHTLRRTIDLAHLQLAGTRVLHAQIRWTQERALSIAKSRSELTRMYEASLATVTMWKMWTVTETTASSFCVVM